MDKTQLVEYCRQGEEADRLLAEGHAREALKTLETLAAKIEKSGEVDSYLVAKVTLSYLRCYIKLGDFKNAYRVWNAGLEDSLFGLGIYALESAQTNVRDMVTYDMVCAFLHTLGEADRNEATQAVNQYLSRVCEHAIDDGDRVTMHLALSNWKQHLKAIHPGSMPFEAAKPLIEFEREFGKTVAPHPIDFPVAAVWEKPEGFREMSQVAQKRHAKVGSAKKSKVS